MRSTENQFNMVGDRGKEATWWSNQGDKVVSYLVGKEFMMIVCALCIYFLDKLACCCVMNAIRRDRSGGEEVVLSLTGEK